MAAANAKKDIYCEKPLTHTIAQGQRIVDAVRQNKIVFQTGSQQRSEFGGKFRQAVEYVRNGRIGKVKTVRVGVGGPPIACDLPARNRSRRGPTGTSGSARRRQREYNAILCPKGVHRGFPQWRRYKEYAGGALADMGAHHFDIAQWALDMDVSGPVEIQPPADDAKAVCGSSMPMASRCSTAVPAAAPLKAPRARSIVDRGKIESTPAKILEEPLTDKDRRVYFCRQSSPQLARLPAEPQRPDLHCRDRRPFRRDLPPGEHRLCSGGR